MAHDCQVKSCGRAIYLPEVLPVLGFLSQASSVCMLRHMWGLSSAHVQKAEVMQAVRT